MEETLDRYDATVAAYGSGWVGGWRAMRGGGLFTNLTVTEHKKKKPVV